MINEPPCPLASLSSTHSFVPLLWPPSDVNIDAESDAVGDHSSKLRFAVGPAPAGVLAVFSVQRRTYLPVQQPTSNACSRSATQGNIHRAAPTHIPVILAPQRFNVQPVSDTSFHPLSSPPSSRSPLQNFTPLEPILELAIEDTPARWLLCLQFSKLLYEPALKTIGNSAPMDTRTPSSVGTSDSALGTLEAAQSVLLLWQ